MRRLVLERTKALRIETVSGVGAGELRAAEYKPGYYGNHYDSYRP